MPALSARQHGRSLGVLLLAHDQSRAHFSTELHRGRFSRPIQYPAVEIASGLKFQRLRVRTRLAPPASFTAIRLLCE